jgi:hypothetical protein
VDGQLQVGQASEGCQGACLHGRGGLQRGRTSCGVLIAASSQEADHGCAAHSMQLAYNLALCLSVTLLMWYNADIMHPGSFLYL